MCAREPKLCFVMRGAARPAALLFLVLLGACASLPTDYTKEPGSAIRDTGDTQLAEKIRPLLAAHPGESGFYMLPDGIEAMAARLLLIQQTDVAIDAQYYYILQDIAGALLIRQLVTAADRGVRGVDGLTDFQRLNHRMHNKSITFDNVVTIIGGRNIGDEYFGASDAFNYHDLDVLNSSIVDLVLEENVNQLVWAPARVVFDLPYGETSAQNVAGAEVLVGILIEAIDKTTEELFVVSPYFVPGDSGVERFRELRERGVRCVVVTNSLASTDVAAVYGGYKDYQKPLLSMGVLIESDELAAGLVDSVCAALPGAAWQLRLNDEGEAEWVDIVNGMEVVYTKPPQTSAWRRFGARVTNLDAFEGQL